MVQSNVDDFDFHFPVLSQAMTHFEELTNVTKCGGKYHHFKNVMKNVFVPLVRNELVSKLPEWELLEKVKNGGVTRHSFTVLYLVMLDPIFIGMSPEQKNTLKWAALLHDICKRGEPEFNGRDYTHPFMGGLATLQIFFRLGFLNPNLIQDDFE